MNKEDLRIVFMGTPEFATAPLKALLDAGYSVVAAVTAPDKKAGRGQQIRFSPVKEFCLGRGVPVMQPEKLKADEFLNELASYRANLFIVVAFRMLPEKVWAMPELGTFNLHASLLPQYRGAAPINYAIINGETKTGLTTFFLEQEIDTGNILLTKELEIGEEDDFGSLHDRMMLEGAELVLQTVKLIQDERVETIQQDLLASTLDSLKPAPKIFPADCKINWNRSCMEIHNLIRGLSPFPAAWTILKNDQEDRILKVYKSRVELIPHDIACGTLLRMKPAGMKVACSDGFIHLIELQQSGKKRMPAQDFLAGFKDLESWHLE